MQAVLPWHLRRADYPRQGTIHRLLRQQSIGAPRALALPRDIGLLIYKELEQYATCPASSLREFGVRRGTLLTLHKHRPPELVATVQAGGTDVPLDRVMLAQGVTGSRMQLEARVIARFRSWWADVPRYGPFPRGCTVGPRQQSAHRPAEGLWYDPLRSRRALRRGALGIPAENPVNVTPPKAAMALPHTVSPHNYTPVGFGKGCRARAGIYPDEIKRLGNSHRWACTGIFLAVPNKEISASYQVSVDAFGAVQALCRGRPEASRLSPRARCEQRRQIANCSSPCTPMRPWAVYKSHGSRASPGTRRFLSVSRDSFGAVLL